MRNSHDTDVWFRRFHTKNLLYLFVINLMKPSSRIQEIAAEKYKYVDGTIGIAAMSQATIDYLDEEWEKKSPECPHGVKYHNDKICMKCVNKKSPPSQSEEQTREDGLFLFTHSISRKF